MRHGRFPLRCPHMALLVSLLGRAQGPAPTLSSCGIAGFPYAVSIWPRWFPLRCPPCGLVGFAVGAGHRARPNILERNFIRFLRFPAIVCSVPQRGTRMGLRTIRYHQGGDPRGHTNTECASSAVCATSLSVLRAFARDSYPHVRPLAFPFKSEKKKENCHGPSSLGVLFCP